MAKDLNISILLDFYGDLLTEKQRDYFDLYYNEDLSLAEIAEQFGISRQGVRDNLMRAESALQEYEEKTGLVARFARRYQDITRAEEIIARLQKESVTEETSSGLRELAALLESMKG